MFSFAIFVINLMCAAAKSSDEVNVATIFWTHPLCTNFSWVLLSTGQSAMSEFAASDLSICFLGIADNPFIFWYKALMLFCCLLCLLNLSPCATRVSGVVVGAVAVVNLKFGVDCCLDCCGWHYPSWTAVLDAVLFLTFVYIFHFNLAWRIAFFPVEWLGVHKQSSHLFLSSSVILSKLL